MLKVYIKQASILPFYHIYPYCNWMPVIFSQTKEAKSLFRSLITRALWNQIIIPVITKTDKVLTDFFLLLHKIVKYVVDYMVIR